nr:uncharacterized protein LOC128692285 [Cherax quadricarinatus]
MESELLQTLKNSGILSSYQFLKLSVAETKNNKLHCSESVGGSLQNWLILVVSDGHVGPALAVLPYLKENMDVTIKLQGDPSYLPDLPKLLKCVASHIHLFPEVKPEHLQRLPSLEGSSGITLYIYDVSDAEIKWANEVVRVLCPDQGEYDSLVFPRSQLTSDGCRALVVALADHGTPPGRITLSSTLEVFSKNIISDDIPPLTLTTRKTLRCKFIMLS